MALKLDTPDVRDCLFRKLLVYLRAVKIIQQFPGFLEHLDFTARSHAFGEFGRDHSSVSFREFTIDVSNQIGSLVGCQPELIWPARHNAFPD
jgi:hypothetical protein